MIEAMISHDDTGRSAGDRASGSGPGLVPFGARLRATLDTSGPLCVGIDPHGRLLADTELGDTVRGLEYFGDAILDAAAGRVGIVKPQAAFYERFGSRGLAVLESLTLRAREFGLLVIADVKRGDISSTLQGYADAWLREDSPFYCDAVTLASYLGIDSLGPAIETAVSAGRGVFALAATSNPEAFAVQDAVTHAGLSVAESVVEGTTRWNARVEAERLGGLPALCSLGVVVGATLGTSRIESTLRAGGGAAFTVPVLAPGFGSQGARLDRLRELFGPYSSNVVASVSRAVVADGLGGAANAIERLRASCEIGAGA